MNGPGHRGPILQIYLPNKVYHVPYSVIVGYIPGLLNYDLSLQTHPLQCFHDKGRSTLMALRHLFDHLSEISKHNTSTVLLDCLETPLKQEKRRRTRGSFFSDHSYRSSPTIELFQRFGEILAVDRFQGTLHLFDIMRNFFAKYCDRICERDPDGAAQCIVALDRMDHAISDTLACVASRPRSARVVLDALQDVEDDLEPCLPTGHLQAELEAMLVSKIERSRKRQRELIRLGGQRPLRGREPQGGYISGTNLTAGDVVNAWVENPRNIIVRNSRGERHRRPDRRNHLLLRYDSDADNSSGYDYDWDEFGPPERKSLLPGGDPSYGRSIMPNHMADMMGFGGQQQPALGYH